MRISLWLGFAAGIAAVAFKLGVFVFNLENLFPGTLPNLIELGFVLVSIPFSAYLRRKLTPNEHYDFVMVMKAGMRTVLVAACIITAFTYVYFKNINADILENALEVTARYMAEQNSNVEDTTKALEGVKQFYSPFVQATSALFGTMFAGLIVSMICAFIFKRE